MGKKKQASGLGRQIIKDRFGNKNRNVGDSFVSEMVIQVLAFERKKLWFIINRQDLDFFLVFR